MERQREDDEPDGTVPLSRVRGPGRGTAAAAVSVALIVGLLVAKPWSTAAPTGTPRLVTAAAASPTAADTPAPPAPPGKNAVACLDDRTWRVVTLERGAGTEQRGWYRVSPMRQPTSATLHRMQFRRIVTGSLDALGFCAPAARSTGVVRFWRLDENGAGHRLDGVEVLDDSGGAGMARLFRPPSLVGPYGFASWPIGSYIVVVEETDGSPTWLFGLRLERTPDGR
jgi:hypothetical protein